MTRPKRHKKIYTPKEKAAALAVLAANSGSTRKTSRQLAAAGHPIPEATIRGFVAQPLTLEPETAEMVEEAKRSLDAILESVVTKLAKGLDKPEALARIMSRPVQAATVLGILTDKMRVLRGQPDSITQTLSGFLSTAKWVEPEPDAPERRPN